MCASDKTRSDAFRTVAVTRAALIEQLGRSSDGDGDGGGGNNNDKRTANYLPRVGNERLSGDRSTWRVTEATAKRSAKAVAAATRVGACAQRVRFPSAVAAARDRRRRRTLPGREERVQGRDFVVFEFFGCFFFYTFRQEDASVVGVLFFICLFFVFLFFR